MHVHLYTGTGGAGTTTLACAHARWAAGQGHQVRLLAPGDPDAAASVWGDADPAGVLGHGQAPQAPHPGLGRFTAALGLDDVPPELLGVLPALDDLALAEELRLIAAEGRCDTAIVDLGPWPVAVRLFALPGQLLAYLDAVLGVDRRVHRALTVPGDPLVPLVDDARRRLGELTDVLTGPGTTLRLVTTAQEGAQQAARRALTRLGLHGARVDVVLVGGCAAGSPALDLGGDRARAVPRQRPAPRGERHLLDLARSVDDGRDGAPTWPAGIGSETFGGPAVTRPLPEPSDDGQPVFELTVALPHARREALQLARRGDQLVVSVGPDAAARRVLDLPSALRRCRVTGARLDDADPVRAALRVTFEPDPALWRPL